jgi:hypothetical protein
MKHPRVSATAAGCADEPTFKVAEGHNRPVLGSETTVLRTTASWLVGLGGASMVFMSAAWAGNVVSTTPVSCGSQFMLYLTVPLWSRGSSSLPRYGLRIGEFHKRPTTPQLVAIAPVQRELIDLHIVADSDVRVVFGRRLVWDIPRGAFGPQSSVTTFAIEVPIKNIRLSDAANQQPWQPWDPAPLGIRPLTSYPVRTWQVDGERPAIVNVVIPLHLTATESRPVYMQLRPTIELANPQPTEAVLPLRNADARPIF